MFSPRRIWRILASTASLALAAGAFAQTTLPPLDAKNTPTPVQIIPVSLKNDHVAATVNGEKVLIGDVKKILDQRPYPVTLTEEQKKQLRHAALDVLIEDVLMRQYLNKHVPQINPADFNKEVQDLIEGLKKEMKTLDQFLAATNQTKEQVSRDIAAKLQWRVMLTRFCPDDKAKGYYAENKLFFDKVFVKASHILIKLDAKTAPADRAKVTEQLRVLRQEILTGKVRFEEAAKKYSDCPSKEKGGDIGQFPYKFVVVPEFAKAAFSMKKGELSDVVTTNYGLHLIWVTDRTAGELSTFDGIKDTVREVWAQDEDLYQRILVDQRKNGAVKVEMP
ncbi:MAG: peptidylprolyl isomerase [Planctomycetes bacterium]|nr:peptidylprolyl isomerase [Planctomycetota bacterium]